MGLKAGCWDFVRFEVLLSRYGMQLPVGFLERERVMTRNWEEGEEDGRMSRPEQIFVYEVGVEVHEQRVYACGVVVAADERAAAENAGGACAAACDAVVFVEAADTGGWAGYGGCWAERSDVRGTDYRVEG